MYLVQYYKKSERSFQNSVHLRFFDKRGAKVINLSGKLYFSCQKYRVSG